jgi:hypothetical protein
VLCNAGRQRLLLSGSLAGLAWERGSGGTDCAICGAYSELCRLPLPAVHFLVSLAFLPPHSSTSLGLEFASAFLLFRCESWLSPAAAPWAAVDSDRMEMEH